MEVRGTSILIHDLGCGATATALERVLRHARGIIDVYVNPATETAYVRYDPALIDPQGVAQVIEEAGYRPERPGPA